ncbi:MAG TPA: hypothetical protein VF525_10620 [Pyrinomonadaceae bacterium]|jgi:hypothetical protein
MLLLYHDAVLAPALEQVVAAHLSECDFCAAELFLLTKFPPASLPQYAPVPMPEPLHRLARALLSNVPRIVSRTLELIYDSDRLTLTDA